MLFLFLGFYQYSCCGPQVLLGTVHSEAPHPVIISVVQVLLGTTPTSSHIVVSIAARCLLCNGCKRERCLLCLCLFFLGILVPSMQHSCHVLHAFCFYYWPSLGTVACLLFTLHVCHASTVTVAFRYPLCFFLGLLHTRTVPVMSLLVFFLAH